VRAIGVLALALSLSAAAAAASSRPALRVVDLKPFTVHGYRFESRQHLRIVITTKKSYVRRLETSGQGTFTLKLLRLRVRRCGQYSVRVYGPHGLLAGVKSPPQSCGAQLQP
jgi:hypothetical protein